MAVDRVPVDKNGNWLSYDGWCEGWDTNVKFSAQMEVVSLYSGRSAKGAVVKDVDTDKKYQVFMTDFIDAVRGHQVAYGVFPWMEWEACKRGANYGIRPAKDSK